MMTKKELFVKLSELLSEYPDDHEVTVIILTGEGHGNNRLELDGIELSKHSFLAEEYEKNNAILHICPS